MTNRGINEQLLEDMRVVVTKQREEWKKFTDELPPILNDSRIIVYSNTTSEACVLIYHQRYSIWSGIEQGKHTTASWYYIEHLAKKYDLWKPLIIVKPDGKIE